MCMSVYAQSDFIKKILLHVGSGSKNRNNLEMASVQKGLSEHGHNLITYLRAYFLLS